MISIEYINWKDYFETTWLDKYNSIKNNKESSAYIDETKQNDCLQDFIDFIYSSCQLLKYYTGNQGLYYSSFRNTIKGAFRYNIIEDGEAWIIIFDTIENKEKYDKKYLIDLLYVKHFNIFEELYEKLSG